MILSFLFDGWLALWDALWAWTFTYPISGVALWTEAFFVLFLAYAAFHAARREGRTISALGWVMFAPVLLLGYPLDVVWNSLFGSLMYWELPWTGAESWKPWAWTFTRHCKKWLGDRSLRGKVAGFWQRFLNTFAPGHI